MNQLNLSELLIDIDYQKKFTYEERVDFFNKYGYSTAMPFFTPIYHLTTLIFNNIGYAENPVYGYGHGKVVLDNKMLDKAKLYTETNEKDAPYKYKALTDTKEWLYFRYHRRYNIKSSDNNYFSLDSSIRIWNNKALPIEEALSIKLQSVHFSIPRENIYKLVITWLLDFKYLT